MINIIRKIFGLGTPTDYNSLLSQGAIILDVRTHSEFKEGHVDGAINISVQELKANLNKLKKGKPIITCCASGMRSASAKAILKGNGFEEVYNAGSWVSLYNKLEQKK